MGSYEKIYGRFAVRAYMATWLMLGVAMLVMSVQAFTSRADALVEEGTGTIVIVKQTVGGDGSFNFNGDLGSFSINTAQTNTTTFTSVPVGSYDVSEDSVEGWTLTDVTCDHENGDEGNVAYISLSADETVTCTFTNTKKGHIIIKKETAPGTETSFTFYPDWLDEGSFSLTDGEQNDAELNPGTYSIEEGGQEGWVQESATCDDGSDISEIELVAGETITCTFVNKHVPVLTIVKEIDGDSTGSFSFYVSKQGEENVIGPINLYDNGESSNLSSEAWLEEGTWDVTEYGQEGWVLADVSCEYDGQSVGNSLQDLGGEEITVDNGDEVTCTFVNTQRAVLFVHKTVINDNGLSAHAEDFSFVVTDNEEPVAGPVHFDENGDAYVIVDGGEGHSYSISEADTDNYAQTYEGCTSIVLDNGQSATCAITNDDNNPGSGGGGGGGSGGGNGPPQGSFGSITGGGGQVLGVSTSTIPNAPSETVPAAPACDTSILLMSYMRMGMQNNPEDVKKLQNFLNKELGTNIPVTGFFGPLTDAAVRAFQKKYLGDVLNPWAIDESTGYVFKTTLWKINELLCPGLNRPKPQIP